MGIVKAKMNNHDLKVEANRRIEIMKGHMDALAKMIRRGRSCLCLLDQSSAIQNSLKSLDALIIKEYLRSHLTEKLSTGKDKDIKEILEFLKRVQRRQLA